MSTAYMTGFANEFATEALTGALPENQNSPQKCAYGLYAEQISGTAFTAPRHANRRTWMYRIRPGAMHQPFVQIGNGMMTNNFGDVASTPNQLRWNPRPIPEAPTDFIEGWFTMAGNGSADAQTLSLIHI
jgi:homogentisate 1,2-dioxygenase